jgi:gliding motility-associated-like protein
LGPDIIICAGEISQISAVGIWTSYLWNTNSVNSSISADTAGIFWCEVTNGSNCVFRDSIQIQENAVPQINLLDFDTISCNPFLVNFEATSDLVNTSFSWDFGDGSTVFNVANPSHNYTLAGVYDLTITASIFGSCENVLFVEDAIHVLSRPTADFEYEILSSSNDEIELALFNNSINYQNLNWYFDQKDSSQIEDITYVFDLNSDASIEILLIASNDYCSSQILKIIKIPGELIYYVPNSFTPDGNIFNNEFLPIITEGVLTETYHLMIFDRWGEIVFESYDFEIGWDGTYNYQLAKEGIYVWKINFTEKESSIQRVLTGHVNLLK